MLEVKFQTGYTNFKTLSPVEVQETEEEFWRGLPEDFDPAEHDNAAGFNDKTTDQMLKEDLEQAAYFDAHGEEQTKYFDNMSELTYWFLQDPNQSATGFRTVFEPICDTDLNGNFKYFNQGTMVNDEVVLGDYVTICSVSEDGKDITDQVVESLKESIKEKTIIMACLTEAPFGYPYWNNDEIKKNYGEILSKDFNLLCEDGVEFVKEHWKEWGHPDVSELLDVGVEVPENMIEPEKQYAL